MDFGKFEPKKVEYLSKIKQKWVRSLHQKKFRSAEHLFVVEGEKSVFEGLKTVPDKLELLICLESFSTQIPNEFRSKTQLIHPKELEQLSTLKTPNKCLAVFKEEDHKVQTNGLILALDGVQDPGNMGTILRLADWFGVSQIVCSLDTVDCYNSKVIQASMGAVFRISVHYVDLENFLQQEKLPIYGAMLNGNNYRNTEYVHDSILVMGNEGNGIRPEIQKLITQAVTIPRYGQAESLNVATATAVLLAEMKHEKGA